MKPKYEELFCKSTVKSLILYLNWETTVTSFRISQDPKLCYFFYRFFVAMRLGIPDLLSLVVLTLVKSSKEKAMLTKLPTRIPAATGCFIRNIYLSFFCKLIHLSYTGETHLSHNLRLQTLWKQHSKQYCTNQDTHTSSGYFS